jgi:hypothetical protein
LTLPYLRDDGKVLRRRFNLAMREAKLRSAPLDKIGYARRAVLQAIENIAAHQREARKFTHDTQSLFSVHFFGGRLAPVVAEESCGFVIRPT